MEHSFTPTEWKLMECLWEKGSVTGREAVDYLHAHAAWSRSTTLTMLRRMTEKGIIACGESKDGIKMLIGKVSFLDISERIHICKCKVLLFSTLKDRSTFLRIEEFSLLVEKLEGIPLLRIM